MDLLTTIQRLKAQLAGTSTNNQHNSHNHQTQHQQINNQSLSAKPSNNLGLIIPIISGSLLIGSLFTYFYLKSKKKPVKYE